MNRYLKNGDIFGQDGLLINQLVSQTNKTEDWEPLGGDGSDGNLTIATNGISTLSASIIDSLTGTGSTEIIIQNLTSDWIAFFPPPINLISLRGGFFYSSQVLSGIPVGFPSSVRFRANTSSPILNGTSYYDDQGVILIPPNGTIYHIMRIEDNSGGYAEFMRWNAPISDGVIRVNKSVIRTIQRPDFRYVRLTTLPTGIKLSILL